MDAKTIVHGRNTSSQALCQMENGQLKLFISAKTSSTVPLIHLAEYLLDFCGIKVPSHIRLLHTLLTEPDDQEVEAAFVKAGLHVENPMDFRREHISQAEGTQKSKHLGTNLRVLQENRTFAEVAFWKYASSAMDLPDPFDFRDLNAKRLSPEATAEDLLQEFHGHEKHRRNGDIWKPDDDRRLYLMRHHVEPGVLDEGTMNGVSETGSRIDPNSTMKFLGETLVSEWLSAYGLTRRILLLMALPGLFFLPA